MPKLKKVSKNEWAFEADYSRSDMPKEVEAFLEQKLKSGELEQMSPEQIMLELMTAMPEALIDISHEPTQFDDLATTEELLRLGSFTEAKLLLESYVTTFPDDPDGWGMLASAFKMLDEDVSSMLACRMCVDVYTKDFPKTFDWKKAKIDWGFHENRPFLTALSQLVLSYADLDMYEPAIKWAEKIIHLNPTDNIGIRSDLVGFYLETKQYQKIFKLGKKYPEDTIAVEIPYGEVLAYCYLDDIENAQKAWLSAQEILPLVAKELAKKRHPKPKNMDGYATIGGADQAYYYWETSGQYWQNNVIAQQLIEDYRNAKK